MNVDLPACFADLAVCFLGLAVCFARSSSFLELDLRPSLEKLAVNLEAFFSLLMLPSWLSLLVNVVYFPEFS
jgi:hypothetical protein